MAQLLNEELDPLKIFEASNGAETIELAASNSIDLILLDMNLPDIDGLEVLHNLQLLEIMPKVLVLSMHPEEIFAPRVMKAGAYGYISKSCELPELLEAIKTIREGKKYISPKMALILAERLHYGMVENSHEILSDRELQVLILISKGSTAREVAHQLGISINSVATYRARIRMKTGLQNTADFTRYVMENNL